MLSSFSAAASGVAAPAIIAASASRCFFPEQQSCSKQHVSLWWLMVLSSLVELHAVGAQLVLQHLTAHLLDFQVVANPAVLADQRVDLGVGSRHVGLRRS